MSETVRGETRDSGEERQPDSDSAAPRRPSSPAAKKVRYTLVERIGTGGMATVHRAIEHRADGSKRRVAIKQLLPHLAEDDEFVSSFIREAQLAAQLHHPNIVRIFKAGRGRSGYFIAMEHVSGHNLCEILKRASRHRRLPPLGVAVLLLVELCDALDYAHRRTGSDGLPLGLIHRDISPANLLIDRRGHLKIIDFGIAKATSSDERTRTGLIKGKYSYMSPEAIECRQLDARADLFSVGVVAHELLSTRPLFSRGNDYDTMRCIQRATPLPPSEYNPACPSELDNVIATALEKDPRDRWQSASVLGAAFRQVRDRYASDARFEDVVAWIEDVFAEPEQEFEVLEVISEQRFAMPIDEDEPASIAQEADPAPPSSAAGIERVGTAALDIDDDYTAAGLVATPVEDVDLRPQDVPVLIGTHLRPPRLSLGRRAALLVGVAAVLVAGALAVPRLAGLAGDAGYTLLAEGTESIRSERGDAPKLPPPQPTVEPIEAAPRPEAPSPDSAAPVTRPPAPVGPEVTVRPDSMVERARRTHRRAAARRRRAATRIDRDASRRSRSQVAAVTQSVQPVQLDLAGVEPPPVPSTRRDGPVVVLARQVTKLSGEVPFLSARTRLPKRVSAKLCIDTGGRVTEVTLFGVLPRAVRAELSAALEGWRYRPYQDRFGPLPACFAVGFQTETRR